MKLGFTGTRRGMTEEQRCAVETYLGFLGDQATEAHHGDCVGSDEEFHDAVNRISAAKLHIHPPSDDTHRAWCMGDTTYPPKAYLLRNHDIVDACEVLIVAPRENSEQLRSGTWATWRYAVAKQKSIVLVYPDGEVQLRRLPPLFEPADKVNNS